MSRNKKPRNKKYRPKPISTDAHSWAIAGSTVLLPAARANVMQVTMDAYNNFVANQSSKHDWNLMAQSVAVASVLADLGIGPNLAEYFHKGQEALERCAIRMAKSGKVSCHRDDLAAIHEALVMYEAQLGLCTQGEWNRAIQRVTNLVKGGGFGRNRELYDAMVEREAA